MFFCLSWILLYHTEDYAIQLFFLKRVQNKIFEKNLLQAASNETRRPGRIWWCEIVKTYTRDPIIQVCRSAKSAIWEAKFLTNFQQNQLNFDFYTQIHTPRTYVTL